MMEGHKVYGSSFPTVLCYFELLLHRELFYSTEIERKEDRYQNADRSLMANRLSVIAGITDSRANIQ